MQTRVCFYLLNSNITINNSNDRFNVRCCRLGKLSFPQLFSSFPRSCADFVPVYVFGLLFEAGRLSSFLAVEGGWVAALAAHLPRGCHSPFRKGRRIGAVQLWG